MLRDIERYLERCALDEASNKPTSLAEHDAQYHTDGFKEGDSCKFRAERAKGDRVDLVDGKKNGGGEKKIKKEGQGQRRTGSASSLSATDRAALNRFHRMLLKERLAINLAMDAYNALSGDRRYETDEKKPKSLPDEVLRWCEDTYARALEDMEKVDRAINDFENMYDVIDIVETQAARDVRRRGNADEKTAKAAKRKIDRAFDKKLFKRSRYEADGLWMEDPDDMPRMNDRRLHAIKDWFNHGLENCSALYDTDRKNEILRTLENAPYEVVRSVYLAHPEFQFVGGDAGYNDSDGIIRVGFGNWSFNGETVTHECGHAVLSKRGQEARQEVLPEFQLIVDALDEDYKALDLPEFGPSMHNDNISSSNEYQKTRNEVKRISLLRTMSEPDFDAMVDAKGEKVLDVSPDEVHEYASIADMLCAATNGNLFCGHSRRYYKSGAAMPLHETVANATAALVMGWKTFPKVFPRTFSAVKKIVYGME